MSKYERLLWSLEKQLMVRLRPSIKYLEFDEETKDVLMHPRPGNYKGITIVDGKIFRFAYTLEKLEGEFLLKVNKVEKSKGKKKYLINLEGMAFVEGSIIVEADSKKEAKMLAEHRGSEVSWGYTGLSKITDVVVSELEESYKY